MYIRHTQTINPFIFLWICFLIHYLGNMWICSKNNEHWRKKWRKKTFISRHVLHTFIVLFAVNEMTNGSALLIQRLKQKQTYFYCEECILPLIVGCSTRCGRVCAIAIQRLQITEIQTNYKIYLQSFHCFLLSFFLHRKWYRKTFTHLHICHRENVEWHA